MTRLSDGREIKQHYTPAQVRDWLTPSIGPNGVETFQPYNNMNPVLLAESFVVYAAQMEAEVKSLRRELDLEYRQSVAMQNDAEYNARGDQR